MEKLGIEKIRQAFKDTWAAATNQEHKNPLMSIPPRPEHDADFILCAAIDELEQLRDTLSQIKERCHGFNAGECAGHELATMVCALINENRNSTEAKE